MTIGGTSSTNAYFTRAIQSIQSQNNSSTATTACSSSTTTSGDSVEISDEAYANYNASKSQGAPPPPPPSDSNSSNDLSKILDSLVDDGTITSDQATAIASALAPPEKPNEYAETGSSDNSDNPLKNALDSLVDDGTVTSDQLSAILSAITPSSLGTDILAKAGVYL